MANLETLRAKTKLIYLETACGIKELN